MKIGIFIAYAPDAEFANQGLGRLLRELVRGLLKIEGTEVVLLCPSWLKQDAEAFFAAGASPGLSILAPPDVPAAVRLRAMWRRRKQGRPDEAGWLARGLRLVRQWPGRLLAATRAAFVAVLSIRSVSLLLLALGGGVLAGALMLPLILLGALLAGGWLALLLLVRHPLARRLAERSRDALHRGRAWLRGDDRQSFRATVFERIFRSETSEMIRLADAEPGVDIWFAPTVFWPEFNRIRGPKVQAFPDMLISEFPSAFAVDTPQHVSVFRRASAAIKAGRHFTAYSATTAQEALGRRFGVAAENVHVILHAAMDLSRFIDVRGTPDDAAARVTLATGLIHGYRDSAWAGDPYLSSFDFTDARFIFYPSQFRPNKNILNLVKAFEMMLRRQFEGCKLVLTGNVVHAPEVAAYIRERRLDRDVISAFGASDAVLAALYARARLVVNPTLYEGGFPFTFAEGMSVGTPSMMSNIPQVASVIGAELAAEMLFDPYSVEDMAACILRGIRDRQRLLDLQRPVYGRLSERTWVHVAEEHLAAFRRITSNHSADPCRSGPRVAGG
jgi:hypothetical protein